jgi:TRAP-type transport system periplasmic protein
MPWTTFLSRPSRSLAVGAAAALAFGAAACGNGDGGGGSGRKFTITYAQQNVQTTPQGQLADQLAKQVKAATKGGVNVKVFHNGVLGNPTDTLLKTKTGAIQMGFLSPSIMSSVAPKMNVPTLPFLFANEDQAFAKLNAAPGTALSDDLQQRAGITVLAWGEFGFYQILSKAPINSLADMKGRKLIISPGGIDTQTLSVTGADPIATGFTDVLTALQSGLAAGHVNPVPSLVSAKEYEVSKYLTTMNLQFSAGAVIINTAFFKTLPPNYQDALRNAAKAAAAAEVKSEEGVVAADIKQLQGMGVHVAPLPAAARAQWVSAAAPIYTKAAGEYGQALVQSFRP